MKGYLDTSARSSAALCSLVLGETFFGVDAIITGNSKTQSGERGVLTA